MVRRGFLKEVGQKRALKNGRARNWDKRRESQLLARVYLRERKLEGLQGKSET